jgi:hypothetical protein
MKITRNQMIGGGLALVLIWAARQILAPGSSPTPTNFDPSSVYQQGLEDGAEDGYAEGVSDGTEEGLAQSFSPTIGDVKQSVTASSDLARQQASAAINSLLCARRGAWLRAANLQQKLPAQTWLEEQLRYKTNQAKNVTAAVGQFDGSSQNLDANGVQALVIDNLAIIDALRYLAGDKQSVGCSLSLAPLHNANVALLFEMTRAAALESESMRLAQERVNEQRATLPGSESIPSTIEANP